MNPKDTMEVQVLPLVLLLFHTIQEQFFDKISILRAGIGFEPAIPWRGQDMTFMSLFSDPGPSTFAPKPF